CLAAGEEPVVVDRDGLQAVDVVLPSLLELSVLGATSSRGTPARTSCRSRRPGRMVSWRRRGGLGPGRRRLRPLPCELPTGAVRATRAPRRRSRGTACARP